MKQTAFALFFALSVMTACTTGQQPSAQDTTTLNDIEILPGDSTVYGLACEGCTDSILVFLPFHGGDPDTLNILAARLAHRVLGRPDIGDQIAVLRNASDSTVADAVINMDRLKGTWCYLVTPRLKALAGTDNTKLPPLPDSLRHKWLEPKEFGMEIQRDFTVRPTGRGWRDIAAVKQMPVEFPKVKRYREWHILNGHILLSETRSDTTGHTQVISTDTADIVLLRRDSLVLRFQDMEQGYYRKE